MDSATYRIRAHRKGDWEGDGETRCEGLPLNTCMVIMAAIVSAGLHRYVAVERVRDGGAYGEVAVYNEQGVHP